ncbi:hypothetical protein HPB50_003723 [Hyalomma asiaticum]|uniref:Uncharacterized protein n=1 Tax=Hyalomma asiaticum TaxID=266040 RepID=A0ACB7SKC9_HYAAI|nr:hypothetical protein HPB50_003723 [Hyalomma asiaticum]
MDLPRVFTMSPHKRDLRWLYVIVFVSPLLMQRSTAYSVKKSDPTPARVPNQVPSMKREALEPVKPLARNAQSSGRSSAQRLINQVLRGRSGSAESRGAEETNLMDSVRTVGLEPSDVEGRSGASEDTEK